MIGIIAAVYLVTNVLAGLVTTVAAASIVFPFAAATAVALGADPRPFVLAVAYGAAANFATPVGYQTNLIVYGPGGYRYGDYFRMGAPLHSSAGSWLLWVSGWFTDSSDNRISRAPDAFTPRLLAGLIL
jgi:di/tricarboxylate transporter